MLSEPISFNNRYFAAGGAAGIADAVEINPAGYLFSVLVFHIPDILCVGSAEFGLIDQFTGDRGHIRPGRGAGHRIGPPAGERR